MMYSFNACEMDHQLLVGHVLCNNVVAQSQNTSFVIELNKLEQNANNFGRIQQSSFSENFVG